MTDWEKFNTRRYITNPPLRRRLEVVIDWVEEGKSVVELGAGDGFLGEHLIEKKKCEYQGFDLSQNCVQRANDLGRNVEQLDVVEDEIQISAPVDYVVAAELLEHIVDTTAFLRKLRPLLATDGRLIITTPNLATLGRRLLLFVGKNPHMESALDLVGNEAGHIRYFIRSTLTQLLNHAGFRVETFASDQVSFSNRGTGPKLYWLARLWPTMGQTLIVKAVADG